MRLKRFARGGSRADHALFIKCLYRVLNGRNKIMKRNVWVVLIVAVLLGVLGVVAWQMLLRETQPVPASPPPSVSVPTPPKVDAPPPVPPPVAPAVPSTPPAAPEKAVEEPPKEAPAKVDPFGGRPITVETLTGCKEVQNLKDAQLVIEYAPDGVWKVNGNPRAKWTIEGNRVKIYKDGTDEVHYIDIVGNKLVYDGKELNMTR